MAVGSDLAARDRLGNIVQLFARYERLVKGNTRRHKFHSALPCLGDACDGNFGCEQIGARPANPQHGGLAPVQICISSLFGLNLRIIPTFPPALACGRKAEYAQTESGKEVASRRAMASRLATATWPGRETTSSPPVAAGSRFDVVATSSAALFARRMAGETPPFQ